MKKNKPKKKLKITGIILLLLSIYLITYIIYLLWSMPIRHIEINGNTYLKDNYIINYLDINNSSIIKLSTKKLEKKLNKLDLISNCEIKKSITGILKIDIEENKVLFYNINTKKLVLSNKDEIEYTSEYLGIPIFINSAPDEIYDNFIKKLSKIDNDNISMINEIIYDPSIINDKNVDDSRFKFIMNDGNIVYVNLVNLEKFNNYLNILEIISNKNGNVNGCLYLDSNSENNYFNNCEEISNNEGDTNE